MKEPSLLQNGLIPPVDAAKLHLLAVEIENVEFPDLDSEAAIKVAGSAQIAMRDIVFAIQHV